MMGTGLGNLGRICLLNNIAYRDGSFFFYIRAYVSANVRAMVVNEKRLRIQVQVSNKGQHVPLRLAHSRSSLSDDRHHLLPTRLSWLTRDTKGSFRPHHLIGMAESAKTGNENTKVDRNKTDISAPESQFP